MDQTDRDTLWDEYLLKSKLLEEMVDSIGSITDSTADGKVKIVDDGGDLVNNNLDAVDCGKDSKAISNDGAKGKSKIELESEFNQANNKLDELKQLFTDLKIFLPAYNLRRAQETLNNLKDKIEGKRKNLLPRKKFTFKAQLVPLKVTAASSDVDDQGTPKETKDLVFGSFFGFKDIVDGNLSIERSESSGKDIQLINLTNCKVFIKGRPCSVSVFQCTNSEINIGPVDSSVFINSCSECSFQIMCHQLRIHQSRNCQFNVHLTSRGIIEDSTGLVFTPFSWSYSGFDEDLQLTSLDVSSNNWDAIDDFDWLVADKPSPNWSRLKSES